MSASTVDTADAESYVAGRWTTPSGKWVVNPDPSRPHRIASRFRFAAPADLELALASGRAAGQSWRDSPIHDRAAVLARAATLLETRLDAIASDLTSELGRPLALSRAEVLRAAACLRYSARDADTSTGQMYASPRPGERIFTDRVPIGQILTITPWNVPIAIPAWKIGPALVHGNTVLWKPSDVTPATAAHLMWALSDAGLPSGVLNMTFLEPADAEAALQDLRVDACNFTGSTVVGRHLIHVGAQHGKEVLAEMGGKNAAIVLADADLEWAADQIVAAAMGWSGQRCTATSRVIVDSSVADQFTALLRERVSDLTVGDPREPGVDIGPVSTLRQYESIMDSLKNGIAQGAVVITGGPQDRDRHAGFYIQPTVLDTVTADNLLFREEVFGPVLVVVTASTPMEALALANDTEYGLSGAVFTRSVENIFEMIEGLNVGVLHINSETCGADPHVPFGGFGASGSHHKEMGEHARDFFTKIRTVYVRGSRP